MSEIINKINELAAFVSEQDIDEWIVPDLVNHYDTKICTLARKVYGYQAPPLAIEAFKEIAKSEIRYALCTFIFKSEHWRTGRDINTYLLTSINRLANRIKCDAESAKKINILVCPGCKFLQKRIILSAFGDFWKCPECSSELEIIDKEINNYSNIENTSFLMRLEAKSRLYKAFAIHSRSGYKCPDCSRFIPESTNGEHGITCPYPDCLYIGTVEELDKMTHPVGLIKNLNISLQSPIECNNTHNVNEYMEIGQAFEAHTVNTDIQMEVYESFEEEIHLLKDAIEQQIESVKRNNSAGTMMQKVLMYEAYYNMLHSHPADMVSYLVHQKQSSDFPLQVRIFQEYVGLMQDALPYTISHNGEEYEVVSLLDPKISLFEGISNYDAVIKSDYTIPNNTTEHYIGGRKFKNYGPCFIGHVIDINDRRTGESIKHNMRGYSFVQIKMNQEVVPGTPVSVVHYRIASHYEMGPLVYLQRIRKKLVNSISLKVNKKQNITDNSFLQGAA